MVIFKANHPISRSRSKRRPVSGGNMQRWIFCFVIIILILSQLTVNAIELMYIDTRGYRHFSCSVGRRGAKVAVKDEGNDRFQIRSSIFTGELYLPSATASEKWCTGLMGAARVICGLCEHPQSRGKVEDRKKQLGLNDGQ